MIKRYYALSLLLSVSAMQAGSRFGEGFGIGAFTGLVGGALISKATTPTPTYFVTQPSTIYIEDPSYERQLEMDLREQQLRERELDQRRRSRAMEIQRRHEYELRQMERERAKQMKASKSVIVENTVVETRTPAPKNEELDLRKREIALKEQQIQLDLIREQKELQIEQNKQKQLEIQAKELELKIVASKRAAPNDAVKTVTTTISKRAVPTRELELLS